MLSHNRLNFRDLYGKDNYEVNISAKEMKVLRNKNITLQNDLKNEKERADSYYAVRDIYIIEFFN